MNDTELKTMLKQPIETIRECCGLMASNSANKDHLRDAYDAIDWMFCGVPSDAGMTFAEVCDGLGIDADYSREIVSGNLRATCLNSASAGRLSRYLDAAVATD